MVLLYDLDGVLIAADKMNGDFHEDDVETLVAVGDQASVVLENSRLRREVQSAYLGTITALADAVEAKDPYTHGHCERVARFAQRVAEELDVSERDRSVVFCAALLHDVGKIAVSDGILNKPGELLQGSVRRAAGARRARALRGHAVRPARRRGVPDHPQPTAGQG